MESTRKNTVIPVKYQIQYICIRPTEFIIMIMNSIYLLIPEEADSFQRKIICMSMLPWLATTVS